MAKPVPIANAFTIYSRLFRYVRAYWLPLVVAMLASMVYSGVDSWFVYFLKPLLNQGLVEKNKHFLRWAPLIVLGAFTLRGTASFFSNYNIAFVSRNVIMRLRQDLFRHIQRLPAYFFDHTTSGSLLSVVLFSVEQVANASADVITNAIQASCLVLGLLVVMFSISWKLSLLYFVIMPMIAIIMRTASKRVRRLSIQIQSTMAKLTHITEENIEGYKVVRTFGAEDSENDKFKKVTDENRRGEMKIIAARAWSVSSVQLAAALALSITLYIATLDIAKDLLTPGSFVALVAAMLALLKPLKDLTTMQNKLYRGLAGAQSVFELLDVPLEVDSGTQALGRAQGHIRFNNVSFAYDPQKPVLSDVSLEIAAGEMVALVGRSGGGKSTLVNLLPRFYPDYSGEIHLDQSDIRHYRLSDLRRQFAVVSQHVVLFNDTIANNIAFGQKGKVNEAAILAAAEAAFAMDFIAKLPQGIHTLIGENGVLLSGGQRQRLAIARAILKDAPILILDEATSALDSESELAIQAALANLIKKRTTLVIAHRLSTVEQADRIIVVDEGKIVEQGNHATLLAKNGSYAKLYKLQFKDVALA